MGTVHQPVSAQQAALKAAFGTKAQREGRLDDVPSTPKREVWTPSAKTDAAPIVRFGLWSVGASLAIFALWSLLAPLSSAVITQGTLIAAGGNKRIQHDLGGRITQIFVHDGERVVAGQPLFELDTARAQADVTKLKARYASLAALKARLQVESDGETQDKALDFLLPPDNAADDNPTTGSLELAQAGLRGISNSPQAPADLGSILRGQQGLPLVVQANSVPDTPAPVAAPEYAQPIMESQRDAYRSGRAVLYHEVEALERKADTLDRRRESLEARLVSEKEILKVLRREVDRMVPLARDGYLPRNRVEQRRAELLEQEAKTASLALDMAGIDSQILEIETQIAKTRAEAIDEASREMTRIVSEMAEIKDQIVAAQ